MASREKDILTSKSTASLLRAIGQVVGAEHVLDSDRVAERASHFWDSSPLLALALVRPADTAQTAAVLKLCNDANQPVVTHGGVTGLVQGDKSDARDIILSTERLNDIEPVEVTGRTVAVGSGAILHTIQQHAIEAGLQFGLDLGARGSCTIGGNIATNAGGLQVLRYGMTREQILGLEVVLADGTILSSMNSMMKNNAGYDLKHLFIGSEGTLGIITRAVLRLRPATPAIDTALLAFDSFEKVTTMLGLAGAELNGTLDAFEVIWKPFYQLNTNSAREGTSQSPLSRDHQIYVIVESRGANAQQCSQAFEQVLERALDQAIIADAVIAQSERERANIWHIREHIEIALQHDPVFVYDISLPIVAMADYLDNLEANLKAHWPEVIVYAYGHLADGNLHILVAPPAATALTRTEHDTWYELSNNLVYQPLQALGGSISAEHGIGLTKKSYLPLSRTQAEIDLMRTLKHTLDPYAILNRNKVI